MTVGEVAVLHPEQRLGHIASSIVFNVYALKLYYPRVGKVSDQMVPEVNMFAALVCHQVTGHVHGSMVVHQYIDG